MLTVQDVFRNVTKGTLGILYLSHKLSFDLPEVSDVTGTGIFSYILKLAVLFLPIYLWIVAFAFTGEFAINLLYVLICLFSGVEPGIVMRMKWYEYIPLPVGKNRTGLTTQQYMAVRTTMDSIRTYNNSSSGPGKR